MFKSIGPVELIIILAIVLLLFGAGRVGRLGKELGTAVSEFRKGMQADDDAQENAENGKESGSEE
ncbi:MAG: twin-arginine translocase TatA/TatE family subunit [Chloroflexota bacterium]|jgi:sec-independent protein translocase protein TatA